MAALLKTNYRGCLFFGSSLEKGKFNDIDVFILLQNFKQKKELEKKLKKMDERLSPIFGIRKELKEGVEAKDMLYSNIIAGLPFSCEDFVIETKYRKYFLRRKDVEERFILSSREIFSCLEFEEPEYTKKHLEKGIIDIIYAVLNHFDLFPRNDLEARKLFKEKVRLTIPRKISEAVKFVNKLRGLVL